MLTPTMSTASTESSYPQLILRPEKTHCRPRGKDHTNIFMVFSTHRNKLEEAGRDGRDGHGTDRLREKWG